MSIILALESATKVCSVALFRNESLIAHKEVAGDYSHAENLAQFTDELIKEQLDSISEISAVAISKGPGSYTGLRIGASFAKGLCYSLKIPLIAIDTLSVIAASIATTVEEKAIICPMIDARRMEVYTCLLNNKLELLQPISSLVIDEKSFEDVLKQKKVYFLGDGADKCKNVIHHKNAHFLDQKNTSARFLGELAFNKFKRQEFEDVAYFEPFYLKEFIALKGKKLV